MRALLITFASLALLSAASPKPDFTGVWKLNVSKSDFGNGQAPQSMVSTVEHKDPEIKVHSETTGSQGKYATDYKWVTDGRDNLNTVRGNQIHATVIWSGKSLISNAKTSVNGVDLTIVDQWSLSADGKTLTISRTMLAPQGNAEQTYVYEK